MTQCDCSDEYGPCEQHADTLVVREGASLHTADELSLLIVEDLRDCGVILSRHDQAELDKLNKQLSEDRNDHSGVAWFQNPDNADAAQELAQRAEGQAHDLYVVRDDGYTIVRPHPDCPLLETS